MKLILNLIALLMVRVDFSHESHMELQLNQMEYLFKERPPMVVNCPERGTADNKAQRLLNQDITTLRNYFTEKCSMSNSLCKRMTVPQYEEKICELRRLKVRLFPQGTNGPAQPITAFNCNQYTSEEKQGCPRPSPAGADTFGTSSFWPFVDSGSTSTRNIPWQTVRNNWDRVIQEKINEYIDKMKVYESTGGAGLFGGSSYNAYSSGRATSGMPSNFYGFQASRGNCIHSMVCSRFDCWEESYVVASTLSDKSLVIQDYKMTLHFSDREDSTDFPM